MVRATFAGFNTAYSALQANQKRLDLVGQNLANMNTPGYTRQQLQVSTLNYSNPTSYYMSRPELTVGFGARMDAITQIRDPYLDIQYRGQMQKSGYSNAMQESLDRLSDIFDESHIDGLRSAFADIQSSLLNLQDPPKSLVSIYESELRTRMQALTNLLNDSARQINEAKMSEFTKLEGTGTNEQGSVQQINDILQRIGRLNRQIKQNQIYGQPSLELMDDRNLLIDELASYIPIEVSYFKDEQHDGLGNVKVDGTPDEEKNKAELYHLDSAGNIIAKKEWPDDLRITMSYTDKNGDMQKLVLVEGTEGTGEDNYGKFEITNTADIWKDKDSIDPNRTQPGDLVLSIKGVDASLLTDSAPTVANQEIELSKGEGQFTSGSVQASLDMLWKDGTTTGMNDVRGYDFYMDQLDTLASSFAEVMNTLNNLYEANPANGDYDLLASKYAGQDISALSIGISQKWVNGDIGISRKGANETDTILNMLEAMTATYPYSNLKDANGNPLFDNIDLKNNSFADFANYTSTILANDSYNNQNALKTNVTVLNGIQNSRDSVSGVSLDEEASNMMTFMSAYNAASRLLTTLDQALDVLINGTGVVGR